ncbi:MAG: DUF72 domain-containing protein [Verrucomicrobiae bacterium]|nr:DUF72 domain-containing protein [Verrucomicrobiae bacterium]
MSSPAFDRDRLRHLARAAARHGVFVGTSSWKYPGWIGQLYTRDRYLYRGAFSETRFERDCLTEYAEVFSTVSVDATYYRFPDERLLNSLLAAVPAGFRFTFKVTDTITVRTYPRLPRYGDRAGQPNPHFLDADRFAADFLAPCAILGEHAGVLIFEFSRFHPSDFARGRDFVAALDTFLARLPAGWRYGVEIRNRNLLHADYFATLARHGAAHVFTSWEAMPPLADQLAHPGAFSSASFTAARLLLKPGRAYADAVRRFAPYDRLIEPYPEGRTAAVSLLISRQTHPVQPPRPVHLFVNNRFEGNALLTLDSLLAAAFSNALPDQGDPPVG